MNRILRWMMFALLTWIGPVAFSDTHSTAQVVYVEKSEVILRGGEGWKPGNRLFIHDYSGKRVAIVEVKEIRTTGDVQELVCKKVHGTGDINPGFTAVYRRNLLIGYGVDFFRFSTGQKANAQYAAVTASPLVTPQDYGWGVSLDFSIGTEKARFIRGLFGCSFSDLGKVKVAEWIHLGVALRPDIRREVAALEFGATAGIISSGFGDIKWARPEGSYSDALKTNSGLAKVHTLGGNRLMFPVRVWTAFAYHVSPPVAIQAKVGYYLFGYDMWVDKSTASDADFEKFKVQKEWLERDLGHGGFGVNVGLIIFAVGNSK